MGRKGKGLRREEEVQESKEWAKGVSTKEEGLRRKGRKI